MINIYLSLVCQFPLPLGMHKPCTNYNNLISKNSKQMEHQQNTITDVRNKSIYCPPDVFQDLPRRFLISKFFC